MVLFLVFMTTSPLVPSFVTNPVYRENKTTYNSETGITQSNTTAMDAYIQKNHVDNLNEDKI